MITTAASVDVVTTDSEAVIASAAVSPSSCGLGAEKQLPRRSAKHALKEASIDLRKK